MDAPSKRGQFTITSTPDETRVVREAPAEAREEVALPLRLLFVSDLLPHRSAPNWEEGTHRVRVDPYRYTDLMQSYAPRLDITVPNRLSETPSHLELELTVTSLKGLRPDRLLSQIPELTRLTAIRGLVGQVQEKQLGLDRFKAELKAIGVEAAWAAQLYDALAQPPAAPPPSRSTSSAAPSSDDAALDRLFSMVDVEGDSEDEAPPAPEAESGTGGMLMDALMGAVTGSSAPSARVKQDAATLMLDDLDTTIQAQLNEVMSHPAVRALERSWRSLKLLVDRLDMRRGIQLEVLAAAKDDLSEALYHQVLMPEHAATDPSHVPLAAIVLDTDFSHTNADLELLADLAETCASLQVPLLAGVEASFFGVETPTGLNKLPLLWQHLQGYAYAEWNALRKKPEASYVSLFVPPLLLRAPYGPDHSAGLPFEEDGYVWGSGALAAAIMMGQSFAQTGWPTHLGSTKHHRLQDMPTWPSQQGAISVAALINEDKQVELAQSGFGVLSGRPNQDVVYLAQSPTLADLEAGAEAEMTTASLAGQLFASRMAQLLLRYQQALPAGTSTASAQADLQHRLAHLFGVGEEQEEVFRVQPVPELATAAYEVLAVVLHPPETVVPRSVRLTLAVQVTKASG